MQYVSFKCVIYGWMRTSVVHKNAPGSYFLCLPVWWVWNQGKMGEGQRQWPRWAALHQCTVMSLCILTPGAMTPHPTLHSLIHFSFISTSNKFFPMKVTKGKWKHLLKRSGIGYMQQQSLALPKICCKGISHYCEGHGAQKQQSFSPSRQTQFFL